MAPSLRSALLGLDHDALRTPEQWGPAVENLVAATLTQKRGLGAEAGFWRRQAHEVDGVMRQGQETLLLEVETADLRGAPKALAHAAAALRLDLAGDPGGPALVRDGGDAVVVEGVTPEPHQNT